MLESVGKIELYGTGFDGAIEFFQDWDQAKFNASLLLLLNIGEQIGKISNEIRSRNTSFPFNEIKGLRNRIAHDYTGIDYEMIFDIVKSDIPAIKTQLIILIKDEISRQTFDLGEIRAASESLFYRHIEFENLIS